MNENNKFSLGGFPPIYEIVSTIKKKEFIPSSIVSIQSILAKRNLNRIDNEPKVISTVNKLKRHTNK
jgi:hypothetical protein